ncbi:MAG: ABC transporter substrate-binding protein [Lachnospiraceae bacterium]|nr:ABC transporter substrate-binding protein [Lachnospiraceae bacterium]
MKKLASRILAAILIATLSLSLIACGGNGEQTGDGVLDCAVTSGLTSLTPFVSNGGRDAFYWKMTYESLGYMNYNKELTPWVAKEWSVSDDNLTYTVTIHDNVYDSAGNHITASDICWFIGEAVNQALKPVFNKLESWEQVDEYTFSMTLKSNMIGVFEYLMEDIFVVSEAAYKASPDGFATECVSTNQYKITEFVASSDWKYELREDYWGNPEDLCEEIRGIVPAVKFHVIAEASQVTAAFATDLVDYMDGATINIVSEMLNNPDDYTVLQYEGHQGYQLFFSGYETSPVADDVKLRQAICYAIDNQALIDGYCQGLGSMLYDVCPSFYKGYQTSWESEEYYTFNQEKAKELVAESNYDGTTSMKILVGQWGSRVAEIIVNELAAVGIKAEVFSPEAALLMAIRLDGSNYDMFINTIGGTYLPDHWSIRYDPNAYATGDGTSRHDYVLGELLYKTWTVEGFTTENINEVHNYLKDNAIAYGLFNQNNFCVYSNKLTLEKEVDGFTHKCYPFASTWSGI